MKPNGIDKLFDPKTVLLIGSSKIRESRIMASPGIFGRIRGSMCKFKGHAFMSDIERSHGFPEVDLTLVSLPPRKVLEVSKKLKTRFLVVLSGGFGESELKQLLRIAKGRFRVLGPNSVCGILNQENGLNTTFEKELEIRGGGISVISQSGGAGAALLDYLSANHLGISKFAWVGDMTDLNECDLLEHMLEDKKTKAVLLYLEALKDPRRFMRIAGESKKPIIALKSGAAEESRKRAETHTHSLSTEPRLYSSAFRQSGVIEVRGLKEMFDCAMLLGRFRRREVGNVAVVSNTGGPSIIAADLCREKGLKLAGFTEKTKEKIMRKCPGLDAINPLDLRADAGGERLKEVMKIIVKDRNVDSVLIVMQLRSCLLEPEETEVLKRVKTGKVVVGCVPGKGDYDKIRFFLRDTLPLYDSIDGAVKALSQLRDYVKRF